MNISVVIPVLDEADHIEAAIESAIRGAAFRESAIRGTRGPGGPGGPSEAALGISPGTPPDPAAAPGSAGLEVLVVDGGSRDGTERIAAAAGVRVLRASAGRARQLEVGARASRGEVLLFLHADTRLPAGWASAVREALCDPRVVGGAFRLHFDEGEEPSAALRAIAWGARLRTALFRLPYGDQALFVRREVLEAIGGVPQAPLMEDLDLVRAMKGRGRLALLRLPAATSARRYRRGGPLRTMLRHWVAAGAWALRVDRRRLARWVRG